MPSPSAADHDTISLPLLLQPRPAPVARHRLPGAPAASAVPSSAFSWFTSEVPSFTWDRQSSVETLTTMTSSETASLRTEPSRYQAPTAENKQDFRLAGHLRIT